MENDYPELQAHDRLHYKRVVVTLLALLVAVSAGSRKELWSHYVKVFLAAGPAHLRYCVSLSVTVFVVHPFSPLPRPPCSPTGKRGLVMGEGLVHTRSQVSQIQEMVSWLCF